jgi:DNA-3-methyladenine glycosylase
VRLERDFFMTDPVTCARGIIGCRLHWRGCVARIVETEAYAAVGDEACHTWNRPSARHFVEHRPAGAAYVYLNYGMYWLLNVLVKGPLGGADHGFVLLRAIEPIEGQTQMEKRRVGTTPKKAAAKRATNFIGGGPGKLGQALGVTAADHGIDFCRHDDIFFTAAEMNTPVETATRIGISRAQELPWRFLLTGSPHVSVRP